MSYKFILFSHLLFLVYSLKGYGDFPPWPVHLPLLSSRSCAIAVAVREREVMWSRSLPSPGGGRGLRLRGGATASEAASTDLTLTWPTERRVRARDASPLLSSFVRRPRSAPLFSYVERTGGRRASRRFLVAPSLETTLEMPWPLCGRGRLYQHNFIPVMGSLLLQLSLSVSVRKS